MSSKYTTIIGLEVHIEPSTVSKMFCGCPQDHFGKEPNTQVCPICLGLPGALPVANKEGILRIIKLGLALGSEISLNSKFYRKHYFYPDLPKAYQTSQLDSPLCVGGSLNGKRINHIHLEEDAGKLIHETIDGSKCSLIDFNRGGCALIEIVTEPDFHSTEEVVSFLKEIQLIAKYLGVSNADMEKGSMRLEANISLSPDGKLPNYKVELKNINSFKFLEKAMNAEIERQTKALDNGEKLIQETRGYDEVKKTTYPQRVKADSHDYRYFPEADLPPMILTSEEVNDIKRSLPELPFKKRERLVQEYSISGDFANILASDLVRVNYFEECARLKPEFAKTIANLMVNKHLDKDYPEAAGLVKKVLELQQMDFSSASDVEAATTKVIGDNPDIVDSYKNGKGQVIGFLIGQTQKELKGKGDPKLISQKLLEKLNAN